MIEHWGQLISGAKVDPATATGDTALTYACENGHTAVAEVLLDYGAELVRFTYNLVNLLAIHAI